MDLEIILNWGGGELQIFLNFLGIIRTVQYVNYAENINSIPLLCKATYTVV